jgi:hypothetical protein
MLRRRVSALRASVQIQQFWRRGNLWEETHAYSSLATMHYCDAKGHKGVVILMQGNHPPRLTSEPPKSVRIPEVEAVLRIVPGNTFNTNWLTKIQHISIKHFQRGMDDGSGICKHGSLTKNLAGRWES